MHGRRQSIAFHSLALVLACWCANSARGQAFGPWRIPSTPLQFFGHSFGAGHHAPMIHTVGGKTTRVPRMTFMPPGHRSVYASGCAPCTFTGYSSAGCGTGHCVPQAGQPHYQPLHQPTIAPPQQVFAPPTQAVPQMQTPAAKQKIRPDVPTKMPGPKKSPMKPVRPKPPVRDIQPPAGKIPQPTNEPTQETLPEPSMPTADPLAKPGDRQAWLNF